MEYIYAKAKTHKFDSLENTKIQNLKFRPVISQIRTYICNGAKVLSDYLKPFCQKNTKSMTHRVLSRRLKSNLH